jgi:tetratricopeptide (TPR) repeat protein
LQAGELQSAWHCCQLLLKANPRNAAGLDVGSRVALAMGQGRLALDLAERAVALDGENFSFIAQFASSLLLQKQTARALELIEVLAARPRSRPIEHDALGNLYSHVGKQTLALECFQSAVAADPDSPHHWLNLALCLQATGAMDDAEQAFERCIALDPQHAEAWLHRSRLRSQKPGRNHVDALRTALDTLDHDWRGRMTLHYALAKELEDLGEDADSFAELSRGSRLRRDHMQHDPQADLDAIEQVMATFDVDYFSDVEAGDNTQEPIFIVGLPRTGTTLVERIIGSHSDVYAAGELNNFAECLSAQVTAFKPEGRMDFVRRSRDIDSRQLARDYLDSTRPQTGHCAHFIDKLPLNFLYCGLIHRAMPNARIVHLSRHPLDTCYAIYKTLFKQAYPFSYDLQELGNYYLAYRRLMQHWHAVMPGVIYDISYEQLVAGQETQTRRLIDYCGLPWEDGCLQFHRNQAPSLTASLAQVRQPVYASSVGRWQRHREGLRPLEELFQRAGIENL